MPEPEQKPAEELPRSTEPGSEHSRKPRSMPKRKAKRGFKSGIIYAVYRSVVEGNFAPIANYLEGKWKFVKIVATFAPGLFLLFAAIGGSIGYLIKDHFASEQIITLTGSNGLLQGQMDG